MGAETPKVAGAPARERHVRRLAVVIAAAALAACAGQGKQKPAEPTPIAARPKPLSAEEIRAVPNPHVADARRGCASCHSTAGARELRDDPNATCQRCHAFEHGNHPVNVVQKTAAPGIPLLAGGKVACHSCHDPHDLRKNGKGLRLEFNALCTSCHTKGGGPAAHHHQGAKKP